MDTIGQRWYFSDMSTPDLIPVYTLFGETGSFPDVVHCEHFSARAPVNDWRIGAHRHAGLAQVFLVDAGRIDAAVDGAHLVLSDGDTLFIPPNKVHRFTFRPETEGLVISVPWSVVKTLGPTSREITAALSEAQVCRGGPQVRQLAGLLAETAAQASPFRAQRAVGLAHALLGLLADLAVTASRRRAGPASDRLARLDQLIATHLAQGWSASDYAAALAISPGHLGRLCRAATGKGTTAYLEQALLDEACRLLAFTDLPVSEIGYRLGYADPSYFSKRFRRGRQQTPSEYRAHFLG